MDEQVTLDPGSGLDYYYQVLAEVNDDPTNIVMVEISSLEKKLKFIDNNSFSLFNNYPNPFNPSTKIAFSLPKAEKVSLIVYNILGQELNHIVNDILDAGTHSYEFNAASLPSGIYFYKLTTGNSTAVKKMQLLK
jgi:hypothetical protein